MTEEQKLINVQIGKRLQTVRENMGYTQEAFAEVLSVDAGHYQKLERGLYGLSTDKLLTLYERYRIDPTYLITGEKNQTFDVELFLANCDREERNRFIERMLAYMGQLMLQPKYISAVIRRTASV